MGLVDGDEGTIGEFGRDPFDPFSGNEQTTPFENPRIFLEIATSTNCAILANGQA